MSSKMENVIDLTK